MTRRLACFVLIFTTLWNAPVLARGLVTALPLMRDSLWAEALIEAGDEGSIARDVIEWHRLRAAEGRPQDIMAFLERRADWPGMDYLRRQSEEIIATAGDATVLAFYRGAGAPQPPQTPEGALSLGDALIRSGRRDEGQAEILRAWQSMAMPADTQVAYLARHGTLLAAHHETRLSRLLWDGHKVSGRRMLDLVSEGARKLAEARIALQEQANGVDAAIAAVPAGLRGDAGLAYDRFAWRDAKRRQDDAIAMMLERSTSAAALGVPEKWLRRRADFARQLMRDNDNTRAYRLAANHFATADAGYGYADNEWIAGYVALRKLENAELAVYHFTRFLAAVKSPISVGRAGYWLGRAYARLGEVDKAHAAYRLGAKYQSSYYGLLSAQALGRGLDPVLAAPDTPDWRGARFLGSSVYMAGMELLKAGEIPLAERFLTHLAESLSPDDALRLGQMAVDMEQPHLAVMISKRAAQDGLELAGAYYPLHPVAALDLPMAPEMTLAIARRESEFDPVVVSHAGARGLMQVMPATAELVARELGILDDHKMSRLTSEWRYNARLGAQYLASLAGAFNGNVVLMAAGYNAGPHRPIAWMERYGDPRDASVDVVDWVEHIPFNETRNYVMRVTESLPVYRARLGQPALPVPFTRELSGRTLDVFAPKGE
ncbi:lytic transglycosylase domain-containing protein [Phaeobacter sp. B1627]|uniref:lytic transglycosylase domain-containing protein n=1 Tax=Phaeobacter sp. B1627 TaxID=2583809 RepID=UPI001118991E|nr:lytic transglycosylase domain-containing protein [Phaeobacter sp. B1627]TNJ47552.1 lytic transglycosylase domain-containing protein [Phaeobacter sp. B1627]